MCREHVVDVRDDYPRFVRAGGDVAVVTMGSVEQTAAFRGRHQLAFACLADPDRKAYEAFDVRRGTTGQIVGPAVWGAGLKAMLRAGVGKPVGDVMQLHASFVIDTEGIVRYVHLPKNSADRSTNDELITALAPFSRNPEAA